MKGHLKQNKIIRLVLSGREAVEEHPHIQSCDTCRRQAEQFLVLLSPSEAEPEIPSPSLEARILRSRDNLLRDIPARGKLPSRALRPLLAGGSIFLIVALTITALFLKNNATVSPVLAVAPLEGEVTVNGDRVANKLILKAMKEPVSVTGKSRLTGNGSFSLYLSRRGILSLKGFHDTELPLIIHLARGTLNAQVTGKDRQYYFTTPLAEILITGTRFRLSAERDTILRLEEGSVRIKALASGKNISLAAGKTCTISPEGVIAVTGIPASHSKKKKMEKEVKARRQVSESHKTGEETSAEQKREMRREKNELKEEQRQMRRMQRSLRQERRRH